MPHEDLRFFVVAHIGNSDFIKDVVYESFFPLFDNVGKRIITCLIFDDQGIGIRFERRNVGSFVISLGKGINERFVCSSAQFAVQLRSEQQFNYQLIVFFQPPLEFLISAIVIFLLTGENFIYVGSVVQIAETFKNPLADVLIFHNF